MHFAGVSASWLLMWLAAKRLYLPGWLAVAAAAAWRLLAQLAGQWPAGYLSVASWPLTNETLIHTVVIFSNLI